jgi:hypothetical protein
MKRAETCCDCAKEKVKKKMAMITHDGNLHLDQLFN